MPMKFDRNLFTWLSEAQVDRMQTLKLYLPEYVRT